MCILAKYYVTGINREQAVNSYGTYVSQHEGLRVMKHTRKSTLNVILIEDSIDDIILIRRQLYKLGWELYVRTCFDPTQFHVLIQTTTPDIVISDYRLPGWSGLEALIMSKEYMPKVPFFFVSGSISAELAKYSVLCEANDYLLKSQLSELSERIRAYFHEQGTIFNQVEEDLTGSWKFMHNLLVNLNTAHSKQEDLQPYMQQIDEFMERKSV